jgi:hypothetical protein
MKDNFVKLVKEYEKDKKKREEIVQKLKVHGVRTHVRKE